MSTVQEGYEKATPSPREDIPSMLVGYDQVEEFVHAYRDRILEINRELGEARRVLNQKAEDMKVIRELLADALNEWASGNDEDARTAIRNAAARAAG